MQNHPQDLVEMQGLGRGGVGGDAWRVGPESLRFQAAARFHC